ncbi:MAG: hypothetical protein KTR15_08080, partial [Phycisphaeraceae bacterium]|nr:hypothetical protein [Phycisphaeraceae bacterium]
HAKAESSAPSCVACLASSDPFRLDQTNNSSGPVFVTSTKSESFFLILPVNQYYFMSAEFLEDTRSLDLPPGMIAPLATALGV